jgi:hypothetical protein
MARSKITISHRAMTGRISRALIHERKQLRADRRGGIVRYMIVDSKSRGVLETNVDLEKLARRLDLLQPWEKTPP